MLLPFPVHPSEHLPIVPCIRRMRTPPLLQLEASGDKPSEGVLVCGDSGNDVELFAVPGVRSCMVANAHEELKQWCDQNGGDMLFKVGTGDWGREGGRMAQLLGLVAGFCPVAGFCSSWLAYKGAWNLGFEMPWELVAVAHCGSLPAKQPLTRLPMPLHRRQPRMVLGASWRPSATSACRMWGLRGARGGTLRRAAAPW
jgi:hypothetical protein